MADDPDILRPPDAGLAASSSVALRGDDVVCLGYHFVEAKPALVFALRFRLFKRGDEFGTRLFLALQQAYPRGEHAGHVATVACGLGGETLQFRRKRDVVHAGIVGKTPADLKTGRRRVAAGTVRTS